MFLAVHQHGSFTRAARSLDVAQSTVSTAIREFERALGQPLFTREGRRVRLSALGEAILSDARRLATAETDLLDVVRAFEAEREKSLMLATNESVSTYLLPEVTRRIGRTLPHLRLQVQLGLCPAIREQVLTGHADVAVLVEPARPEDEREGAVTLGETPLVLCAGPSHPLVGRVVRLGDVCDRVVMMTYTAGTYARLLGGVFRSAGFPEVRMQALGSIEAVKRYLKSESDALALLPGFVLRDDVRTGELVELRLERPLPSVQIKVLWAAGTEASGAQDALSSALRSALRDHRGDETFASLDT
ncbi:DNA-binding transcriptional LysR family regulator [Deinococcus yavapaiensis KR-236]|uniref:DNA-binding transcriptional LysR family regulator n=2 Tax=Deinococcus TaxID=1298 RepID=A0A318S1R6_9DEIO|nr:DNA-binding transcriptional LysR family regulator [Deinococcus yavapaiensis KR-236]